MNFKQRKAELEREIKESINKFPRELIRARAELKGLQEGYDLAKAEDLKIIDKVLNPCNLTYEDYEGNEDEWFWFRQQELKAEISKSQERK